MGLPRPGWWMGVSGATEARKRPPTERRIKAGPSERAVAVIESRGSASPESLKKLGDVLGVRASELLER